jgi:hypothetical protein
MERQRKFNFTATFFVLKLEVPELARTGAACVHALKFAEGLTACPSSTRSDQTPQIPPIRYLLCFCGGTRQRIAGDTSFGHKTGSDRS